MKKHELAPKQWKVNDSVYRKRLLGKVCVDSGLLMITDPCCLRDAFPRRASQEQPDWNLVLEGPDAEKVALRFGKFVKTGSQWKRHYATEKAALNALLRVDYMAAKQNWKVTRRVPMVGDVYQMLRNAEERKSHPGQVRFPTGGLGMAQVFSTRGDGTFRVWVTERSEIRGWIPVNVTISLFPEPARKRG